MLNKSILSSCQTIMSHMEFVTGYTSLQLASDNEQYWKFTVWIALYLRSLQPAHRAKHNAIRTRWWSELGGATILFPRRDKYFRMTGILICCTTIVVVFISTPVGGIKLAHIWYFQRVIDSIFWRLSMNRWLYCHARDHHATIYREQPNENRFRLKCNVSI